MSDYVPPFTSAAVKRGFILAQPLAMGGFVYGMVFGVLAAEAKLSGLEAVLMSATVYSGSAQIAALQVWTISPHVLPLVATVIVMNLRYVLYSATLRPWIGGLGPARVYPILCIVGDTSWALSMAERAKGHEDAGFLLGAAASMFLPWTLGTLVGHWGGTLVHNAAALGLDFMLVALSAAMGLTMWRGRADVAVVVTAAVVAIGASQVVAAGWVIVAAAVASAAVGYFGHDRSA